jgi:hypothetical protein
LSTQQVGADSSLEEDHELLAALEIFGGMSPEEMIETVTQMMSVIGDDPETQAELKKILELLPMIQSDSTLLQMAKDDEVAAATNDALRMIGDSDWDTVWEMQDVILEAVLESGQLSADDAASFKTDEAAWKEELKFIYDELQKQATLRKQAEEL